MPPTDLTEWGWTSWPATTGRALGRPACPARVLVEHRGHYDVVTAEGVVTAVAVSPVMRRAAAEPADFPAVGDWVLLSAAPDPVIEEVLVRRGAIIRRDPGRAPQAQVLAANVDIAVVVTSASDDLNVRRLERQLVMAVGGGAEPVVVITKADLVRDPDLSAAVLQPATRGRVPVVTLSNVTGAGLAGLEPWLRPGATLALIGSSGVGKSSLVNSLAGARVLATDSVRDDGRGRHTTIRRELVRLPGGALIIDTPGLREVQLWDTAGLDSVFDEVAALAGGCRFADCHHDTEPGCHVREAAVAGHVSGERVRAYRELRAEAVATQAQLEVWRRPARTGRPLPEPPR
jgi:ribosome biogenesis GTPase / thiamine phosphate phosphatase